VFSTTFKNISVTTFVAEIGVPREIHRQLWELLYTYHVIKQCTEKETTSIFLLTIKLNYIHDLKIMLQCLLHLITYFIEITPNLHV
jgi:hypothetical protein